MAILTIDTQKDSAETVEYAIEFLRKVSKTTNTETFNETIQITATHSEPTPTRNEFMMFDLPVQQPQQSIQQPQQIPKSAEDLLNMCVEEMNEEIEDEIQRLPPKKQQSNEFSNFMPY